MFDKEGVVRSNFSYTGQNGRKMAPHGIRVDEKGCVLVADQAVGSVSLYANNNHLISHVIENIKQPLAIAYSSEDHLIALSDCDSLQLHKI